MAERAAVHRLREQLNEAWQVNENLIARIDELSRKLAKFERNGAYESEEESALHLAYSDHSRRGARVFRWPKKKHSRAMKVRQIEDLEPADMSISSSHTRRGHSSRDAKSSSVANLDSRNRSLENSDFQPDSHISNHQVLDRKILDQDFDLPVNSPEPPSHIPQKELGTPNKKPNKRQADAIFVKEELGGLGESEKPEDLEELDSSVIGERAQTPEKTIKTLPFKAQSARVEKTKSAVRFTVRPESQPLPRRRRVTKVIMPDDTVNITLNQSGVISDSPARAKRQTFRI